MSYKRTYVDAGVLIAVARGDLSIKKKAMGILDDPSRKFVSSTYLELEVVPKAIYNKKDDESEFYQEFFDNVSEWAEELDVIVEEAHRQARAFGLAAMDALHVAAAVFTGAHEFITTEKSSKPIHRVTDVRVISLQQ